MKKIALIVISAFALALPLASSASGVDDVTMQVMDSPSAQAGTATKDVDVPGDSSEKTADTHTKSADTEDQSEQQSTESESQDQMEEQSPESETEQASPEADIPDSGTSGSN